MARETKRQKAERRVKELRSRMDQCGGNLDGYVARYGSSYSPDQFGMGGEIIYQADIQELREREEVLAQLDGIVLSAELPVMV